MFLKPDQIQTLTATITPDDATDKSVTWSSDKPEVATVDDKGVVTALTEGEAKITVTTTDGRKTATCTVTITSDWTSVTGVELNESTIAIVIDETKTLVATITPDDATDKSVLWSSSQPEVASVDKNGKVTGLKEGKAVITATTTDKGKTATCTVTVTPDKPTVTGVTLNKSETTITVKGTETLIATVTPDAATDKSVLWSSSHEDIATVNENGKVTALKIGETVITVKTKDGEKTANCAVSVVAPDNILDVITDPAFLAYAKYRMNASQGVSAAWDTNGDGILSPDEAAAVSTIVVDPLRNYGSDLKVASLDGIEYFWGLRTLEVENQELTEIDLSNNLQVGSLRCKNNKLTKLNISNDNLNYLDCDNNQLTEINVSELPNLRNLDFRNNQVTEINISNNPSLRVLRFNDNQVSVLDISQNTNLQQIHCYNNRISTLDATTMSQLNWQLFCGNQTSDGVTPQDITVTLTDIQKELWVSKSYSTDINNKRVIIY